jgi:putative Mg2+ transporter-C (MgtC) family protein
MPQAFMGLKNGDPERIAAQVVSGIGFLGAGAIIKLGNNVRGLTTAASIWATAALGLAIGAGLIIESGMGLAIILFTLIAMEALEKRFFPRARFTSIFLYFSGNLVDTKKIQRALIGQGVRVDCFDVVQDIQKGHVRVRASVAIPPGTNIPLLYKELRGLRDIYKIKMDERG